MEILKGFESDNTPRGTAANVIKEMVQENSNGRVRIEFCSNELFSNEHDIIKAIQEGTIDIHIVGANMLASIIPEFAALSLPFLTQNIDEGQVILDGEIGEYLITLGKQHGFQVVTDIALGYAQITTNVRPINVPEDLKGLTIRSPNDVSFIETFKAFGTNVTVMPYSEIYNSLKKGEVDGQFNPLANTFDLCIDQVQDYLAMTNHSFYVAYIIMNKNKFDSLTDEFKQLILDAGIEGKNAARKFRYKNEGVLHERSKALFKEITYPETLPFKEAVQPVYNELEKIIGVDMIYKIQGFLKQYRG